ncbi:unnamed protein product, partial [Staurois parvus]
CQCPSVPPTSASSSVPISATYHCPSVQAVSAHHCSLIRGTSVKEKNHLFSKFYNKN